MHSIMVVKVHHFLGNEEFLGAAGPIVEMGKIYGYGYG